jgi:hypothetical protein
MVDYIRGYIPGVVYLSKGQGKVWTHHMEGCSQIKEFTPQVCLPDLYHLQLGFLPCPYSLKVSRTFLAPSVYVHQLVLLDFLGGFCHNCLLQHHTNPQPVTVFLRPLSPCDLVCAEFQLAACTTPFHPSLLCHKCHSTKWAPDIHCSNHIRCCVAQLSIFHLLSSQDHCAACFTHLLHQWFLFPVFKWVAIQQAWIAKGGF